MQIKKTLKGVCYDFCYAGIGPRISFHASMHSTIIKGLLDVYNVTSNTISKEKEKSRSSCNLPMICIKLAISGVLLSMFEENFFFNFEKFTTFLRRGGISAREELPKANESLNFSSRVLQVVVDVLIPSTIQDLPDRYK